MTTLERCPVCGIGCLTPQVSSNPITLNGTTYDLPCYYSICNRCESEVADADDVNENAKLMKELRQKVENEMAEKLKERKNE